MSADFVTSAYVTISTCQTKCQVQGGKKNLADNAGNYPQGFF